MRRLMKEAKVLHGHGNCEYQIPIIDHDNNNNNDDHGKNKVSRRVTRSRSTSRGKTKDSLEVTTNVTKINTKINNKKPSSSASASTRVKKRKQSPSSNGMTTKETNESQNNSNKNNNSSGADQSKLKTTKGTTSTISHDLDTDLDTDTYKPVRSDNQKLNTHHHHQQQPTKKRTKKIPRKQRRMKRKGIHFHNGKITSSNCNSNSHLIKRTLECIDISIAVARKRMNVKRELYSNFCKDRKETNAKNTTSIRLIDNNNELQSSARENTSGKTNETTIGKENDKSYTEHLVKSSLSSSSFNETQSNDHEKTPNSDINASIMDQVKEERVEPDQKTLEEIHQSFSIKGSDSREIDVNPLNKKLPQTTQERQPILEEVINDNHKVLSSTGTNIPSNNLERSSTMSPKEMQATCINSILRTSQRDDIDQIPPSRCTNIAKNNAKSELKTNTFVCGQSETKQIQSLETVSNHVASTIQSSLQPNDNLTSATSNETTAMSSISVDTVSQNSVASIKQSVSNMNICTSTTTTTDKESNTQYAFVDSETKEPFMFITLQTSNEDLSKIFNEQKRRSNKNFKLAPLVLFEISTISNVQNMRQLNPEESSPHHANTIRNQNMLRNSNVKKKTHQLEGTDNPYVDPDLNSLGSTFFALTNILNNDCECFKSVQLANAYYDYWRPTKPKVIILAESHVSTPEDYSCHGPIFDTSLLGDDHKYSGPVNFCSLVYCLGYGEHEALTNGADTVHSIPKKENTGTWQFWNVLSALISLPDDDPSSYGKDIQKSSNLTLASRIKRKFEILQEMKEKGIWLLDTSVVGWYIQQPTHYEIARKSKKVTKLPNFRPHPKLKQPCLKISWEGYVKNLVRKAANDGELKLLIPIGKDVEAALGKERLIDAVSVEGQKSTCKVMDSYPAPNARIIGGYTGILHEMVKLVHETISGKVDLVQKSLDKPLLKGTKKDEARVVWI